MATPDTKITPGLAQIEQAVVFTNAQVLDPTAQLTGMVKSTGMEVGANALADQGAAMMIEDMATYLQSMEMVLVAASARGFEKLVANEIPVGTAVLAAVETMMTALAGYSTAVIASAATVKSFP